MSQSTPVPGILWVNSDVIKPNELLRADFDAWYSDEHIPDVLTTSGVQSARRYEHITNGPSAPRRLGFLTVYTMPDINFMHTKEFMGLEGQSPGPNQRKIFEKAEFDTRSYELVQIDEAPGKENSGPALFLLCSAISHSSDSALDKWYREEHVPLISKIKGYRRTSRYCLASRSVLSAFDRSFPEGQKWLSIHEFDGQSVPWEEIAVTDNTERAKEIIAGIENIDFGCFKLKRVFYKHPRSKV